MADELLKNVGFVDFERRMNASISQVMYFVSRYIIGISMCFVITVNIAWFYIGTRLYCLTLLQLIQANWKMSFSNTNFWNVHVFQKMCGN